jgi:flagellar L-ring protein precursor FlgH
MTVSTLRRRVRSPHRLLCLCAVGLSLAGCNAFSRLASVGDEPHMTSIENPVRQPSYRPVSLPMPTPEQANRQANSLWRPGARAFFKDQRAGRIGDILTVLIEIEDEAQINNKTTRSRKNNEDAALAKFLGYESELTRVLPETISPGNLVDMDSAMSNEGSGSVDRGETIKLKVAAVITQLLPNGNMVLIGRQEVRVNFEVRELQVAGVVRPEDIRPDNTVTYDKVAEARISYGGRGHISDIQQPRYGQQIFDIIFPF